MKLSIITINYNNKVGLEKTVAKQIGIILLSSMFVTLAISSLTFIFGVSMQSWIFPLSVFIGCIVGLSQTSSRQSFWKAICFSLGIIFLSLIIATNLYDYSYDGLAYHQKSIYYLMHGWNPNYEMCPDEEPCNLIWVNHYAKGIEYIASAIALSTGNIESGKAVNIIFLTSLFFFAFDILRKRMSKAHTCIISALIAYPAIALTQILTYYIDWSLYLLITLEIISLYNFHNNNSNTELVMIGMLIIFAVSIKFNYVFWVGLLLLIYSCVLIYENRWTQLRKGIITSCIAIGFAYIIVSFNPYVTNLLQGHSLFYPLSGSNSIDIMTNNTPVVLQKYSYWGKVLVSIISAPSNNTCTFPSFHYNFQNLRVCDSRIGGFGPYFFWVIVISLVATFICWFRRERNVNFVIILEIGLFISLFILPSGWWARYVAFFALFPLPILIILSESKKCKFLRQALIILLLLNNMITFLASVDTSLIQTQRSKYYLNILSKSSGCHINYGANEGFRFKVKDLGLKLVNTNDSTFMTSQLLISGPAVFVCDREFCQHNVRTPHFMDGIYDKITK